MKIKEKSVFQKIFLSLKGLYMKEKKESFFKEMVFLKNRGFSLVEMLITLALLSILIGIFSYTFLRSQEFYFKVSRKAESLTNRQITDLKIYKDLLSVQLSFTTLKTKDDSNNIFFDVYKGTVPKASDPGTRKITLSVDKPGKLVFLKLVKTQSPKDLNKITFDLSQVFKNTSKTLIVSRLQPALKDIWPQGEDNRLILFSSSFYLRKDPLDPNQAPRLPSFLGFTNGDEIQKVTNFTDFRFKKFFPGVSGNYSNFEDFLRKAPLMSDSYLMASSVEFLVYRLDVKTFTDSDGTVYKKGCLFRCVKNDSGVGDFGTCKDLLMLDDVELISFERKDITRMDITFNIETISKFGDKRLMLLKNFPSCV